MPVEFLCSPNPSLEGLRLWFTESIPLDVPQTPRQYPEKES